MAAIESWLPDPGDSLDPKVALRTRLLTECSKSGRRGARDCGDDADRIAGLVSPPGDVLIGADQWAGPAEPRAYGEFGWRRRARASVWKLIGLLLSTRSTMTARKRAGSSSAGTASWRN